MKLPVLKDPLFMVHIYTWVNHIGGIQVFVMNITLISSSEVKNIYFMSGAVMTKLEFSFYLIQFVKLLPDKEFEMEENNSKFNRLTSDVIKV